MPTGAHRNGEAATPGTGGSEDRSGGMLIIRSLIRSSTAARPQGKKLGKGRGAPGARAGLPQEFKMPTGAHRRERRGGSRRAPGLRG